MDIRNNDVIKSISAHKETATCLDFNKLNEHLMISSSIDGSIALWDLRNINVKLHSFDFHNTNIDKISWNKQKENIFASKDKKNICIWDIENIGLTQSFVEDEESPVELEVYLLYNYYLFI
jgi:histone-binding protein RBBP4